VKAEGFLQLLKFLDKERFFFHLAEIPNSNSLNEVEDLGLEPIKDHYCCEFD
jgi:hypothetical protein